MKIISRIEGDVKMFKNLKLLNSEIKNILKDSEKDNLTNVLNKAKDDKELDIDIDKVLEDIIENIDIGQEPINIEKEENDEKEEKEEKEIVVTEKDFEESKVDEDEDISSILNKMYQKENQKENQKEKGEDDKTTVKRKKK